MRPFLLVFLLLLCTLSFGQETVKVVRSDLQVANRRGMLIPPEAGLVSALVKRSGLLRVELCLLDHEVDLEVDRALADGFSVRSLETRLGETAPVVFFLVLEKTSSLVEDERNAAELMSLRPTKPISEGLKRTGSKPRVDWKAVSAKLGLSVEADATGTAAFALPGVNGTFYGCGCGETILTARLSSSVDLLDVQVRLLRANRFHLTSVTTDGRVYFQGEGEAIDLAARLARVLNHN